MRSSARAPRRRASPSWWLAALALAACTSESHQGVETHAVESAGTVYSGPRPAVAIGSFANRSTFMQGMFSTGEDRLGNQALEILRTHLARSDRFVVLDRGSLDEGARESELSGTPQALTGATWVLTGEVTEFGRRNTGDRALFGVLGRGHEQTACATVSVSVVDARTSRVVHSVQGAGEYSLSDREVLGFGSASGYDSTLHGKVLDLSIADAVDKLVRAFEAGEWGR